MQVLANDVTIARFQDEINLAPVAASVTEASKLVKACLELCRDHPGDFALELQTVRAVADVTRVGMSYKQPQLVALYIHDEVGSTTHGMSVSARELLQKSVNNLIKSGKGKAGFSEFSGWNKDGTISPRAIPLKTPARQGGTGSSQHNKGSRFIRRSHSRAGDGGRRGSRGQAAEVAKVPRGARRSAGAA